MVRDQATPCSGSPGQPDERLAEKSLTLPAGKAPCRGGRYRRSDRRQGNQRKAEHRSRHPVGHHPGLHAGAALGFPAPSHHHDRLCFEPGELGVLIDEGQASSLEKKMFERGYPGRLRNGGHSCCAPTPVWSFVVNNYLMGKDPFLRPPVIGT